MAEATNEAQQKTDVSVWGIVLWMFTGLLWWIYEIVAWGLMLAGSIFFVAAVSSVPGSGGEDFPGLVLVLSVASAAVGATMAFVRSRLRRVSFWRTMPFVPDVPWASAT
ncbi:hypothetical protein [Microbacterium sp. NPDC087665]|uniref:hypothetical protein n=1 Tax=Microbacterium sp. NPDC087665 TaxID=3364194 RepID=UPI0037F79832